jgi:hypothetical protein
MTPPARTPEERRRDTLHRLVHDEDAWVATVGADRPLGVQAWREASEIAGRDLMREGRWVSPG